MELRSNFEAGTSRWATRCARWRAPGLCDEDVTKPKIAVVNSSSDLAIRYRHLDEIACRGKAEKRGWLSIGQRVVGPLREGAVLRG
jgi:dihydroxy-acid dehydratase